MLSIFEPNLPVNEIESIYIIIFESYQCDGVRIKIMMRVTSRRLLNTVRLRKSAQKALDCIALAITLTLASKDSSEIR